MILDLSIFTYGYGDAMYYILNGIAMIMNKKGFMVMIRSVAVVSIMISAVVWSTNRSMGISERPVIIRIMALYFVINGLLTPRMSIKMEDRVSKNIEVVDNLPFCLFRSVGLKALGIC
jgi:TraG-like protein, N-terminal region